MTPPTTRLLTTLALAPALAVPACTPEPVRTVKAFEEAKLAADHEGAQPYLGERPRVWFGDRSGEGHPLRLTGGRWSDWDEHFNSTNDAGPWKVDGSKVYRDVEEWNEYFDLIEREGAARYRQTYFLDDEGKIEGMLISNPNPDAPPSPSRADEVEAWARANHPDEWAYLRPGGEIDPTGDRAQRTRALINEWRESVGLEPIE